MSPGSRAAVRSAVRPCLGLPVGPRGRRRAAVKASQEPVDVVRALPRHGACWSGESRLARFRWPYRGSTERLAVVRAWSSSGGCCAASGSGRPSHDDHDAGHGRLARYSAHFDLPVAVRTEVRGSNYRSSTQVKRINTNMEPVNYRVAEGQIEGQFRSSLRCLRAAGSGQQGMASLAPRRSRVARCATSQAVLVAGVDRLPLRGARGSGARRGGMGPRAGRVARRAARERQCVWPGFSAGMCLATDR
jgi:hypothetical protein